MKWLFIFPLALFVTSDIGAQSQPTFIVEYYYEQKSAQLFFPDSVKNRKVEVHVNYKDDSTRSEIMETTLEDILGSFSFDASITIIANADSSKKYFGADRDDGGNSGIHIVMNTPDTIYYKKGVWQKLSDGKLEIIPTKSIDVTETKETKDILGYTCAKFVSAGKQQDEEITFWACKELPNTLLPFNGLESFKYGILEIEHRKNMWHTRATKIRKL